MKKLLVFLLMAEFLACQEEITPLVPPKNSGNDSSNGNVPPSEPVVGKYANCLSVLSSNTLDVVTWNIENFPKDASTVSLLREAITIMDADIIAVQEISSSTNFNLLVSNLQDYEGVITSSGQLRLGYIYKPSEIISFEPVTQLFTDDASAFPRPPLMTKVKHVSGKEVIFINIHLKCCDDGNSVERRRAASVKLKNYIDQNLSDAAVILLGDYNEDVTQPEGNDVFTNFTNDLSNYRFADMPIATGASSAFSYPSWPSHIDHILVTNELFGNLGEVRTIRFNVCESQYFAKVTDHYPVMLRLTNLN